MIKNQHAWRVHNIEGNFTCYLLKLDKIFSILLIFFLWSISYEKNNIDKNFTFWLILNPLQGPIALDVNMFKKLWLL